MEFSYQKYMDNVFVYLTWKYGLARKSTRSSESEGDHHLGTAIHIVINGSDDDAEASLEDTRSSFHVTARI